MTVRTLTYMDELERDLKFRWFIELGLYEQATIHCGDNELVIDIFDFPCIRVGFAPGRTQTTDRGHPLQMFYVQREKV